LFSHANEPLIIAYEHIIDDTSARLTAALNCGR
jgi:hypothetical protein